MQRAPQSLERGFPLKPVCLALSTVRLVSWYCPLKRGKWCFNSKDIQYLMTWLLSEWNVWFKYLLYRIRYYLLPRYCRVFDVLEIELFLNYGRLSHCSQVKIKLYLQPLGFTYTAPKLVIGIFRLQGLRTQLLSWSSGYFGCRVYLHSS